MWYLEKSVFHKTKWEGLAYPLHAKLDFSTGVGNLFFSNGHPDLDKVSKGTQIGQLNRNIKYIVANYVKLHEFGSHDKLLYNRLFASPEGLDPCFNKQEFFKVCQLPA